MAAISAASIAVLTVIGLFAGLFGGLLGIGGSIIMIPAMTELLGPNQHLYQAAAMIVNVFVAAPAVYQHLRAKAVIGLVVRRMLLLSVVGMAGGVAISELPVFRGDGQAYLIGLFGVFLLMISGQIGMRLFDRGDGGERGGFDAQRDKWKVALVAGVPAGLVGGLLGVGGGVVAVPFQNRWLGVPLRSAIANSAAMIVVQSAIGAVGKNYALTVHHPECTLSESVTLAAVLIPTAIVGSLVGARLTHVLPLKVVRGVLVLFLVASAVKMIMRGVAALPG